MLIAFIVIIVLPAFLIVGGVKTANITHEQQKAEMEQKIRDMQNVDEERFQEVYKAITDGANDIAKEIVIRTTDKLTDLDNPEAALKDAIGDDMWQTVKDINN